jgi:hypothetical protein
MAQMMIKAMELAGHVHFALAGHDHAPGAHRLALDILPAVRSRCWISCRP